MQVLELATAVPMEQELPLGVSEFELLERAYVGDIEAFGELFGRHAGTVYHAARKILGTQGAEDLHGLIFERAWLSLDLFEVYAENAQAGKTGFAGWLHVMTTHKALDIARRQKRIIDHELPHNAFNNEALGRIPSAGCGPEASVVSAEHGPLQDALEALLPIFRDAVIAVHIDGLTCEEYAVANNIKPATVRTRVHRGVQALLLAAGVEGGKKAPMARQKLAAHIAAFEF